MILIGFGGNLPSPAGPPKETFRAAIAELARQGIRIAAQSRVYTSPPWPAGAGPVFYNCVARVTTRHPPGALMQILLKTETVFGRIRREKWGPRTLDLDLLDYHGLVEDAAHVSLPHPAIPERAFVLLPLAEVAPQWRHPETGDGVDALISALTKEDVSACQPDIG
jgi:2-amino-4-hydroxy-6-hydroxymethyldihydropteridine diphosphokinase